MLTTAACGSTVAGTPVAATAPSTAASSSAQSSNASGGITVPPETDDPTTADPAAPTTPMPDADGAVGDPGIGDPYYPEAGNGGYQVDHYDVDLTYDPDSNRLDATTTVTGTVTSPERLGRFNLDLQPEMEVDSVTVSGVDAAFDRQDAELVVTPVTGLDPGSPLEVVVTYGGEPGPVSGGTANLGDGGWFRTDAGGALALGEPTAASAWYPVNEHPADTATFAVTAVVPDPFRVISNGIAVTDGLPDPGAGRSAFRWELGTPVASYLTTLYIDPFTTTEDQLDDGTPILNAFAPGEERAQEVAAGTKQILEVLADRFGEYPFEAAGGIFTGQSLGFALETATRPVYTFSADTDLLVHELAHQWYGDDVTIDRWADICLNECFASYAPWLYHEDVDGVNPDGFWKIQMAQVVDDPDFWASPLVDMGAGEEFTRVYDRGPLALHALRREIGDAAFDQLLSGWISTYGGRNASFDELEAFISQVAGRDMGPFVDAWFRGTTVPAEEFRYPGTLG
ncbi:M1 family metallopeptidase [Nakamurella flavida]